MDDDDVPTQGWAGRARPGWPWVLAATAVVALLLSGASPQPSQDAQPTRVGVAAVRPVYHGQYVTPSDVATLQAQGLATAEVVNRELVCQGVELYFDTSAERDAYLADYDARFPVQPPYLAGDPCSPYRSSPHYVSGG